jgi:fatty-acyl-CoA synthase
MILGFSTLACPEWSLDKILHIAARYHFHYLEIHFLHLVKKEGTWQPEFSPARRRETKAKIAAAGVTHLSLGSAFSLHVYASASAAKLPTGLPEWLGLGKVLGASYVRVFPDKIPPDKTREETIDLIVRNLRSLLPEAEKTGVKIGIETHGDFTRARELAGMLRRIDSPWIGVAWDAHHTYRTGGEDFAVSYDILKDYLVQIHFKDSRSRDKGFVYTEPGEGDLPLPRLFQLLRERVYPGLLGAGVEKAWHPEEVAAPEESIPHLAEYFKQVFG